MHSVYIVKYKPSDGLFERMTALSSTVRLEKANKLSHTPQKQAVSLMSGLLLDYAVRKHYPHSTLCYQDGKPTLDEGFISLSHSGDIAAVAVGNIPIGVDIQHMSPIAHKRLAERYFSEEEQRYMSEGDEIERFYKLWTAREAIFKAVSVSQNISTPLMIQTFIKDGEPTFDGCLLSFSVLYDEYLLAVAEVL